MDLKTCDFIFVDADLAIAFHGDIQGLMATFCDLNAMRWGLAIAQYLLRR